MNEDIRPLVSIYVTTHNRKEKLERALNSCFRQSYDNIEIIISDDGSSDNTKTFCESLLEKKINVKYIRSESPKGACHARNVAIEAASGYYITGLDDDDYFKHDRIEKFVNSIDRLNDHSFLYSNYNIGKRSLTRSNRISLKDIIYKNGIGNQIFIEKYKLEHVKGFNSKLPAWQDHELWIRLITEYGSALNVGAFSYFVEESSDSISISSKRIEDASEFFSKHEEIYPEFPIEKINYLNKHQYPMFSYPSFCYIVKDANFNLLSRYLEICMARIKRDILRKIRSS
ncbi:hypothetical protein A1OO_20365 [Enterovibrio norvegicus FF-33]|uniref:glycosyltransferase n=1 Tax=Enterovibrio norvegicus TaxID=188144 RepID=UPI00030F37C3|nr:glycosyltransferase [Enterovibrio norvegicus]OEE68085.1 hypothetical protein A1OO_20365 [Enterovibrio norvegicus FF-33]